MRSGYKFDKLNGLISEIHLACHSTVLEMDSGLRLLIECDAVFARKGEAWVPLRDVIGSLCGRVIVRTTEADTRDIFIELADDSTIKICVAKFAGHGDWPVLLTEPE